MNVGIMSMQRIFNYGSWMQSFALKNILIELGEEVEFVDYHIGKPDFLSSKELLIYYIKSVKHGAENFVTNYEILSRIMPNEWFLNEYYFKNKDLKELLGGSLEKKYNVDLDCLVVGSDEVFNCLQCSPRVGFSPELLGHYGYARRKISYAASFGNTTYEKIKNANKEKEIALYLSEFDSISVRDENSRSIVQKLIQTEPIVNLDPVLIWDFTSLVNTLQRKENDDYLIVYTYPNRLNSSECEAIKQYAKRRNLKIYGINAKYGFLDNMIYDDPISILGYFKYAKCVITDTFHGTLFSIINHQSFVTIVRSSANGKYGNSEKLKDVLKRLELEHRILKNVESIDEIMQKQVDYERVDAILKAERMKSYNYLRDNTISVS